jgi:4-hydroxy-tetrahydrodipicolinate reductase
MIRIGLLGSTGRMGQRVRELLATEYLTAAKLVAEVHSGSEWGALLDTDLIIDFSRPEAVLKWVDFVIATHPASSSKPLPALLIGSTGWTPEQLNSLQRLADRTCILRSSNFSTGVLLLLHILRESAPLFKALGYTPAIVETHHSHKIDAPSGTALSIQSVLSKAFPNEIQTQSVRAGEIVGDHEVTFYGLGDHLTMGHFAQDRSIFARGAIDIGLWLVERNRDTLGFIQIERYFESLRTLSS